MSQTVMGHGCCHCETQGVASSTSEKAFPKVSLGQLGGVPLLCNLSLRQFFSPQILSCVSSSDQNNELVVGTQTKHDKEKISFHSKIKTDIDGRVLCTSLYDIWRIEMVCNISVGWHTARPVSCLSLWSYFSTLVMLSHLHSTELDGGLFSSSFGPCVNTVITKSALVRLPRGGGLGFRGSKWTLEKFICGSNVMQPHSNPAAGRTHCACLLKLFLFCLVFLRLTGCLLCTVLNNAALSKCVSLSLLGLLVYLLLVFYVAHITTTITTINVSFSTEPYYSMFPSVFILFVCLANKHITHSWQRVSEGCLTVIVKVECCMYNRAVWVGALVLI